MFITQHIEGIIPYKLVKIDGELVESYNHALQKLIGKDTKLDTFSIDKRGFSPEINAELGPNYLQNSAAHRYIIIVTPNQVQADLMYDEFSFDKTVIEYVYRNYLSVISTVTRIDSLYGELNDGVTHFHGVEDSVLLNRVTVDLDTPSPFFKRAKKLQKLVDELRFQPDLLIENEAQHVKDILELVEEVGDIRSYNFTDLNITVNVECFYTQLFGGVFLFRSLPDSAFHPVRNPYDIPKRKLDAVRHRYTASRHKNPTKIVVIHNSDSLPKSLKNVEYVKLEDTTTIILFLIQNQLAEVDHSLIAKRIYELEQYILLKEGHDLINITEPEKHRILNQYQSEMPPIHQKLLDANREYQTGNVNNIVPEVQSIILKPLEMQSGSFDVLEKLLCHWWPYDIKTMLKYSKHELAEHFCEVDDSFRNSIKKYCVHLENEL